MKEQLSILVLASSVAVSIQVNGEGNYEPLDPSEISCSLRGATADSKVTKDGYTTEIRSVEEFICEGKTIELINNKGDGEFLNTKKYGKVKIQIAPSLLGNEFSVWVTSRQKAAMKKDLKTQ